MMHFGCHCCGARSEALCSCGSRFFNCGCCEFHGHHEACPNYEPAPDEPDEAEVGK